MLQNSTPTAVRTPLTLLAGLCVLAGLSACSGNEAAAPTATVPTRISAPALVYPVNGDQFAPTTVALTWKKVDNVRSYELQWTTTAPDGGVETTGNAVTDGLSHLLEDLPPRSRVQWKVRSVNVNGESPWSQERVFTALTAPKRIPPPTPLLPENGKMGLDRFAEIRWTPVENALSYEILVTIDEDMRLFQADIEGLQEPALNLTQLIYTYPYWWKVRALGPSGYSEWSPVWIFTVRDGPDGGA